MLKVDRQTDWHRSQICTPRAPVGAKKENHKSLQHISKNDASDVSDNLMQSDDDGISRHQPSSLNNDSGQRPLLLISTPFLRLGKSLDSLKNKFRSKNKKQIPSEDERVGSERKRKLSETSVKTESDQRQRPKRPSDKPAQHRNRGVYFVWEFLYLPPFFP